jgi:Icc protein
MQEMMKKIFLLIVVWYCFMGCENFEYSPNQAFDNDTPVNLNAKNLERLLKTTSVDDTVTIAFVGDSQRFYDEADDFVNKVNNFSSVDFIILAGDITDFGLLSEYEWIHDSFSRLHAPYIGVIGNHDVVANGENVFTRMFGPLNFSFVYGGIKFVVHNTNSREYLGENVPDLNWLRNEMKREDNTAHQYVVGVSHVPPTNGDFNSRLVQPYAELLASTPGFLVSLHGHIHDHSDHYPFNDGVRYITSYAFPQRSFVMLKLVNGTVIKEEIPY